MRTPHTATNKGKRVRIVLRNGTQVYARFIERTDKFVVTDKGRIMKRHIKSFSIIKGVGDG